MKLRLVRLLLGMSVLLLPRATIAAVSLNIRPNLQQFFSGQSVSLSCPGGQESGWTIRRSRGGQTEECGAAASGFGVSRESSCVLDLLSSYTGLYWCETGSGQRTEQINVTVIRKEDSAFILEIPALPVLTGSDVTLRCRHRNGSVHAAYFLKNGDVVGSAVTSLNLHKVQRSDEGFYSCSTDKSRSSPPGLLRVRDLPPRTTSAPPDEADPLAVPPPPRTTCAPPDEADPLAVPPPPRTTCAPPDEADPLAVPPPRSALHLLRHLLIVCPYCVCTVLLVSICCRTSGNQPAVSTETARPSEEHDDVATEDNFRHEEL